MKYELVKRNNIHVSPLNKKVVIPRTIPEPLPDPISAEPFVFVLSAKIGSGKSTTLANLIRMYTGYFSRVYFCSSNIETDDTDNVKTIKDLAYRDQFHFSQDRMFDNFNDDIMQDILDDIKETKKDPDYDENTDHFLIIVDDLSQAFLNIRSLIVKTILKTRHLKLSWIITTQRFRNISPPIRGQVSYFLTFMTNNSKEIEAMSEMLDLDREQFTELLHGTCNEQYKFLFVDSSKNPPVYFSGFDRQIVIEDFSNFKKKPRRKRRKREYSSTDTQTE